MNLFKSKGKREIQRCLEIQIENNKKLRENFRNEQNANKQLAKLLNELTKQLNSLEDENEALKQNVRKIHADNEKLAGMLRNMKKKAKKKVEE